MEQGGGEEGGEEGAEEGAVVLGVERGVGLVLPGVGEVEHDEVEGRGGGGGGGEVGGVEVQSGAVHAVPHLHAGSSQCVEVLLSVLMRGMRGRSSGGRGRGEG